jgi:hypothetical protein
METTYQNIGFFSIYLIVSLMVCVFLTLGIGSPTRLSKDSIFGTFIGVAVLFVYANLFTQVQTFDMINIEYQDLTQIKILNQFLFVAPTESLLFHVFLPSIVIFVFLQKNKVLTQEELQSQLTSISDQIQSLQDMARIHKNTANQKSYVETEKLIKKAKLKKHSLEFTPIGVQTNKLSETDFIIYLSCITAFNVVFSILHWFKSGLSFEIFWSSGIGFLYLSAGMIITLISYRYGWLSGILSHAIYNSAILSMVMLMGGV